MKQFSYYSKRCSANFFRCLNDLSKFFFSNVFSISDSINANNFKILDENQPYKVKAGSWEDVKIGLAFLFNGLATFS